MGTKKKREQIYRYKVTEVWGDAPEQITELLNSDTMTCVDYWRGLHTTWEVYDFTGTPKPKYGWAGTYVGKLEPAAAALPHSETPNG